MSSQHAFLNMLRSLHNIDGYQLPELNWGQQLDFVQNPVKYFVQAEDDHQAAIWREIEKRQAATEAVGKSVTSADLIKMLDDPRIAGAINEQGGGRQS